MSAQPEPQPHSHLRVVTINDETGEAQEGCPRCAAYEIESEGQSATIRSLSAKIETMKRDREKAAREDPLWPQATRLFLLYCRLTGKNGKARKLTWNAERFEEVRPFLKKHGLAMCERAIVGRVFDHHIGQRKNGSPIHYFEWSRIFGSMGKGSAADNFEESCNRAPRDFVSSLEAEDEAKVEVERQQAQARRDERAGTQALASDV